jgi:hypothetical protein
MSSNLIFLTLAPIDADYSHLVTRRHGVLPFSAAHVFIPALAVLSLERDTSPTLESTLQAALAALVGLATTREQVRVLSGSADPSHQSPDRLPLSTFHVVQELALCRTLVSFVCSYDVTFQRAILSVLPQAGPIASRVVAACSLAVVGHPLEQVRRPSTRSEIL